MKIFGIDLKLKRSEQGRPVSPVDDRWYMPFQSLIPTSSGKIVNADNAPMHPDVFSCVKVISETFAVMPLILYRRLVNDQRERANSLSLYKLLKKAPNPRMTSYEFREMLMGHFLLRGNAYAQIVYTQDMEVDSLWPLHPTKMTPFIDPETNELKYKYSLGGGEYRTFDFYEIMHIKGSCDSGLVGKSPIESFKEAIAQGLSMQTYQSNFYESNASPAGILSLPQGMTLSAKAKDNLKADWEKKYSSSNGGRDRIAVLEEGLQWTQIGMNSSDAQFVDSFKLNGLQIAKCFRVPPHKIGILDNAKFNNIESQNIEFYTDTMMPHFVRWEQVIERDLLWMEKEDRYFPEFKVDAILRGDLESRYRAYAIGRQWGWLSVNDIRRKENENNVNGGDSYLQPLNMIEASEATEYLMKGADDGKKEPGIKDPTDDPSKPTISTNSLFHSAVQGNLQLLDSKINVITSRFEEILERLENVKNLEKIPEKLEKIAENSKNDEKIVNFFNGTGGGGVSRDSDIENSFLSSRQANIAVISENLGRVLRKEVGALKTARKKENSEEIVQQFYVEHEEFARDVIKNSLRTYIEQIKSLSAAKGRAVARDSSCILDDCLVKLIELYRGGYRDSTDNVQADERALEMASAIANFIELEIVGELSPALRSGMDVCTKLRPGDKALSQLITQDFDESGKRIYKIWDVCEEVEQ